MPPADQVRQWRARDDAYAVDSHDRAASASLDAFRVKLCVGGLAAADVVLLCTAVGTSLAHLGATPSFVTSVVSNIAALPDAPQQAPVAVLEAYVREVRELERAAVCEAWPRGWVRMDETSAVAIADPPPDEERAQEWLAKVAAELARSGVRDVRIAGTAAGALGSLLGDFGIRVDYDAGSRK